MHQTASYFVYCQEYVPIHLLQQKADTKRTRVFTI